MNAIIVADTAWSRISSSFSYISIEEVIGIYETMDIITLQLSNVVRDIVPAFDTKGFEISLFIFLPDFGNMQISTNSGSILRNLEFFSKMKTMMFMTELV